MYQHVRAAFLLIPVHRSSKCGSCTAKRCVAGTHRTSPPFTINTSPHQERYFFYEYCCLPLIVHPAVSPTAGLRQPTAAVDVNMIYRYIHAVHA